MRISRAVFFGAKENFEELGTRLRGRPEHAEPVGRARHAVPLLAGDDYLGGGDF